MTDKTEKTLVIIFWVALIWLGTVGLMVGKVYDDDATVNVFPDRSEVKNYELSAHVYKETKAPHWFFTESRYQITQIDWPNGGYSEFDSCSVEELSDMTTCQATNGEVFGIKLASFVPPDGDTSDY